MRRIIPRRTMTDPVISIDKEFIRKYLSLRGLCENLPNDEVPPSFIQEYKNLVMYFSTKLNEDLSEFSIPPIAMCRYLPGYCEKSFFLSKIQALQSYIQGLLPKEEQRKIGFDLDNCNFSA